ncbi:lysine transporter LysE [Aquimarina sp. AD10]|uniref:LysE family translocator n=1 Tax=Aquimarina sp. AD10 TaxID=1714849 RepID=UPI000E4EADA2|nr:LysE family transporter [Aquimarina sp. AD10]AXT58925.1 lysine transporter LysE [Aquimarina sp. AD10]RKM99599.1 lysine transporter LysE [Aquimarina sp. AD10]
MSFIDGFIIGLGMIIFIGPVFFLLLNSSLQFGTKAGTAVALGIIVSDILCVLLCYVGLSSFLTAKGNQFWIGVLGSIIIFGLGINYLLKKAVLSNEPIVNAKNIGKFFLKGFSVNFFNPFVFIIWIGVYNYGEHKYVENSSLFFFLLAVLLGILTTDLVKVFLSKKLKKILSVKRLTLFFRITGILLIVFSIRLLYLVW